MYEISLFIPFPFLIGDINLGKNRFFGVYIQSFYKQEKRKKVVRLNNFTEELVKTFQVVYCYDF